MKKEHKLLVFRNNVLRKIFDSKREKVKKEAGEQGILSSFIICFPKRKVIQMVISRRTR